jgi:hypothetical protein
MALEMLEFIEVHHRRAMPIVGTPTGVGESPSWFVNAALRH